MISVGDIKRGTTFQLAGELYSVIEFLHVKPGKGGAFVRTKIRNVRKGSIIDKTFKASEKVEDVRLEKRPMQYLYDEGDSLVFMDVESYDQISLPKEAVGDAINYLKEEDVVDITMYGGETISVDPPPSVVLRVVYAEPGVKGDTATNVQKPVKLETGAEVKVPLFINEGELIRVSTESGEYIERVKE